MKDNAPTLTFSAHDEMLHYQSKVNILWQDRFSLKLSKRWAKAFTSLVFTWVNYISSADTVRY
jgi:hypothetical protein